MSENCLITSGSIQISQAASNTNTSIINQVILDAAQLLSGSHNQPDL